MCVQVCVGEHSPRDGMCAQVCVGVYVFVCVRPTYIHHLCTRVYVLCASVCGCVRVRDKQ